MQTASVALNDKLQKSVDVNSTVRLIAEWNMNRYSAISSVTNPGTAEGDEFDNDVFPLSSIVEPDRPVRGILKAWSSTRGASNTGANGYVSDGYQDTVNGARYTTASPDNKYKYYTSPGVSGSVSPYTIANVSPTVIYTAATWTNKIYICFENSYASPSAYTVDITTDGTTWTTIATTPAIDSVGRVMLYRQANGTWSTTVYRDNPVQIRGVRVKVTQMSAPSVRFNMIELGARIESDLSQFVVSWSYDQSMSDPSFISPLGKASSNDGSVELSNIDSRFTDDNPTSLYYGLLDKNVVFKMDVGINIGTMAAPNYEYIRAFTMRSETWNGQTPEGTTVELKDQSDYLQSVKPNPTLYMDMTVGEIIWRLLDSIGFSHWNYSVLATDPATLIPQFWTDGEKTIWEVIQELAEATQTAVYFDEMGVLQIKTRSVAYNLASTVVWPLDAVTNGAKLPDIISLSKTNDYEANVVNIIYKPTSISKINDGGLPIMESVWEPEDTVALRASRLAMNFLTTDSNFVLNPSDSKVWPYTGMVQIEGEFIKWDAKYYTYYAANGTKSYAWLTSDEDKVKYDKLNPTLAYLNYFNGRMRVPTGGRGLWNTTPMNHYVDATGYTNRYRKQSLNVYNWNGGFIHNKDRSTVTLRTNATFTPNTWYVSTRGASVDSIPYYYGTRLKFDTSGYTYGAAGLAISAGTNDSGYFVELVKTDAITANDRAKYTHELCFYVRYSNGTIKRVGPDGGKGVPIAIAPGVWYDLDVRFDWTGSNIIFSIMVNGMTRMNVTLGPGQGVGEPLGGRYGMFTRGFTSVEFEYLYASTYAINDTFDQTGYWDLIKGGYKSNQWDAEWVYNTKTQTRIVRGKRTTITSKYGSRLFDEFGPIVHEVREFDVKFSKTPVLHSNLYFSNESQVICPEYLPNAFGAKFVLANISRANAVVSGEDSYTFGIDNTVDQKLLIYGRTFTQDDEKTYTVRDTQGVKRRGEVSTDFNSPWIQTEAAAKNLGDWIILHWSGGADEVEVEVFGNPLLQLTDLVSINYPIMNMAAATHKYFVVSISNSYEVGLSTKLTLRRAKI